MKKLHETCTVAGCKRKHKSRGYCASHYQQYMRGITEMAPLKSRQRVKPDCCSEPDCENPVKAKGLCAAHYQNFLRHGHTRYRDRKRPPKYCSEDGCDNILYANGFCHQHYIRRRKLKSFNLSVDRYFDILKGQNNLCAICFGPELSKDGSSGKFKALAVDHCHTTGKVRGLLCSSCNRAVGLLKDSPKIMRRAADYLENHTSAPDKDSA